MLLKMLDSGYAMLAEQKITGVPIQFTHFSIGDAVSFTFDSSRQDPYGAIVFTSTAEQLTYTVHADDCAVLRCLVEHDVDSIVIGNVVLYANDAAFCLCHNLTTFDKITTVDTGSGVRWLLQVYLRINDLMNRFSFDNLVQEAATLRKFANEHETLYPHIVGHDQAILGRHSRYNKAIPLVNVQNVWYGNPLAKYLDYDRTANLLSGGSVGDTYRYDPTTEVVLPFSILVRMQTFRARFLRTRELSVDNIIYIFPAIEAKRIWELGSHDISVTVSDISVQYAVELEQANVFIAVSDAQGIRSQYTDTSYIELDTSELLLHYEAFLAGFTLDSSVSYLDAYRRADVAMVDIIVATYPLKIQYAVELSPIPVHVTIPGLIFSWLDPLVLDHESFIIASFPILTHKVLALQTGYITTNTYAMQNYRKKSLGTAHVTTMFVHLNTTKCIPIDTYFNYIEFNQLDAYRVATLNVSLNNLTQLLTVIRYNRVISSDRTTISTTGKTIDVARSISLQVATITTVGQDSLIG